MSGRSMRDFLLRTVFACGWYTLFCNSAFLLGQQPSQSSQMLLASHLQSVGLQLPRYMPTVLELMRYQDASTTYQRLSVEWDSLPGYHGRVKKDDVKGQPLAPNFNLLDRKRGLAGAAGKTNELLSEDDLVIVGITKHSEVRGLRIQGDPRAWHGEYLVPGAKQERYDVITVKVTIDIPLPDDPLITAVVFLKPQPTAEGGWRLQKIGSVDLQTNSNKLSKP